MTWFNMTLERILITRYHRKALEHEMFKMIKQSLHLSSAYMASLKSNNNTRCRLWLYMQSEIKITSLKALVYIYINRNTHLLYRT